MALATLASAAAAKKLFEKFLDDLYSIGKSEIGNQFARWKALKQIDTLYKKLKSVRMVKTLWQAEKAIDLAVFYYPSKVILGKKPRVVNHLGDFDHDGSILIQGTVGQGKSIFLRYITACEIAKAEVLPLFIELRTMLKGEKLTERILRDLKALGLEMNKDVLEFFFGKGKIVILLDAFDELAEEDRVGRAKG